MFVSKAYASADGALLKVYMCKARDMFRRSDSSYDEKISDLKSIMKRSPAQKSKELSDEDAMPEGELEKLMQMWLALGRDPSKFDPKQLVDEVNNESLVIMYMYI